MSLLDTISNGIRKILPEKSRPTPLSMSMSGGIGNGHGMVPIDDDMIISKPAIIFHTSQIFFNFLAMACFASVASFQAHWGVGPSGLTGFAIFVTVTGILLSAFMMAVPVLFEKYNRLAHLARVLREERVAFILNGTAVTLSLLISFIVTISAWTEPGCKNPDNDPNAKKGDSFKNGLSGWCSTKKAGAIFLWLAFVFWAASLVLLVLDWRSGKLGQPRDPPFAHPPSVLGQEDPDDGDLDEESAYHQPKPSSTASNIPPRIPTLDNSNSFGSPFSDSNRLSGVSSSTAAPPSSSYVPVSRPSMDVYGAFSDPAPSGFGGVSPATAPNAAVEAPRISRTMQYADPYAAVRASVAGVAVPPPPAPPTYETYQGYR